MISVPVGALFFWGVALATLAFLAGALANHGNERQAWERFYELGLEHGRERERLDAWRRASAEAVPSLSSLREAAPETFGGEP